MAYVISYWGNLLCWDHATSEICLRPFREQGRGVTPIQVAEGFFQPEDSVRAASYPLEVEGATAELAQYSIRPMTEASFGVERDGSLASCHRNVIYFGASDVGAWETFSLLPAETFQLISRILENDWIIKSTDVRVPRWKITTGADHLLHFGTSTFRLLIDEFHSCEDQQISLRGSGEELRITVAAPLALRSPPQIWIWPGGNSGNRALQYLVAERLRSEVPGAVIRNIHLPEWGMYVVEDRPQVGETLHLRVDRYWFDVMGTAAALRKGIIDNFILDGFPFNYDFLPKVDVARALLGPAAGGEEAAGFGPKEIVFSVRGAEVLRAAAPGYVVLPPEYYQSLIDRSGLKPVFFGQIGNDPYCNSLRAAFPDALFVSGVNPRYDFDMLRRSSHIAVSVSTFSWLAAWLSQAETIYVPIVGMFSPIQNPMQSFLPLDDSRYRYTLLPASFSVDLFRDLASFERQQKQMAQQARIVDTSEVSEITRRSRESFSRQPYLTAFDPLYYLDNNPDFAHQICSGQAALDHYHWDGFRHYRFTHRFDERWYLAEYPRAAMEIAEGFFANAASHFMQKGWKDGLRPHA